MLCIPLHLHIFVCAFHHRTRSMRWIYDAITMTIKFFHHFAGKVIGKIFGPGSFVNYFETKMLRKCRPFQKKLSMCDSFNADDSSFFYTF